MDKPPLSSVEQVRKELRRLGYFEHGVDRFVLEGAAGASPLRACASAAARVGLLGGLLFGAASSLAAAGLDPRLRSEPRDLLVLALYLTVALGVVTGAAALAGGLVAAWLSRRLSHAPGPRLSRNIGLGLGTLGLAYFALWWRSHAWEGPPALQITSLLFGLGLCLALGRFGALAAIAVLSAGGLGDRLPPASLARRHMLPLLAVIALLFGGGVAGAAYLGSRRAADAPDFAVVPTGLRVRVIGIDGFDPRLAEQMMARGEMPHIQGLWEKGARGRVRAEPEQVPAIVWTTIATGRGPEDHGIQATGARRLPGMRTPVSLGDEGSAFTRALGAFSDLLRITRTQPATSVLRSVKAFWNVASEKGLRIGVVNWWATWPADAINGYVVADRALFKLEKGGGFDRETHPPDVFDRLRPLLASSEERRPRRLDRFAASAAALLRGDHPTDLEVVYLPGLDIETMQQLGDAGPLDAASLEARLEVIRDHYRFVDGLVAELGRIRPGEVVLLVGDPGRLPRRTGPAEGVLVLAGEGVARADLGLVSERDIAPTVVHLCGLPVSRELKGAVLEAALEAPFTAAHPIRYVAAYGRRPSARPTESAFDDQVVEELRSLGYIR